MRLKGFMKVQSSSAVGMDPEDPQGDLLGEGPSGLLSEEAPLAFPPLPLPSLPNDSLSLSFLFSLSEALLQVLNGSFPFHLRPHHVWLTISRGISVSCTPTLRLDHGLEIYSF